MEPVVDAADGVERPEGQVVPWGEVVDFAVDVGRYPADKPEESANIKVEFSKGDIVKIREGAFENFEGAVDSIDTERGIVRVIVTIFGRSTPLDIEYWQIEKV